MVLIQKHSGPTAILIKPTMSKILIYQTDKEFDHCAGLLKNILSVQGKIVRWTHI